MNPFVEQVEVFVSGTFSIHTYRIPAIVAAADGRLLAFCEGRKNSRDDHGDICLLLKRSTDLGRTWSERQVIYDDPSKEDVTIGNPCPVVDQDSGTIWLGFCRSNQEAFITSSRDHGETWSDPVNITSLVKKPDWDWYATGPVNGIQLRLGGHAGRLVMPCDHSVKGEGEFSQSLHSHVIYSDDHGHTWKLGGSTEKATDECTVVELADGRLMLNMRNNKRKGQRAVALSQDGGQTWSESRQDPTLIEPTCQGSLLRYTWPPDGGPDSNRILFSNPASTVREKLTVRLSYDEGKTWPEARLLNAGRSAYSCLVALPDGSIGCLYERGIQHPYEIITFARFSLEWLTEGKDRI